MIGSRTIGREWLAVFVLLALVSGCASLPSLEGRNETTAITDTAGTALARAVAPLVAAHPAQSGIHPLPIPADAFEQTPHFLPD